jgi:hypothetical protein
MEKVWLPKFWASTIHSIWTWGRPNSDKGARRYGPRNPCFAVSPKSDRLSSEAVLGILSSFLRNQVNTKVGDNYVPHNLDTEFALFGVCTWDIWCRKGRPRIRKIWTRLILWKPSFLLSQGRSRTREGGARPKAPQGHKYNLLGTQEGVIDPSIH